MALGAYVLVRFSNDLNDQRVNLGVVLWHPQDGFRSKFTHQLDRAHAVDPRARVSALKQQIGALSAELGTSATKSGKDLLYSLPRFFAHGVEVSNPYPAEISDIDVTLDMLYERLVCPVEEFRRASSQRQFEKSFKSSLASVVKRVFSSGGRVQEIGNKRINGVAVDVGFRVTAPHLKTTWRALSLQSEDRAGDQVAKAKAVALDINVVREALADYRLDRHIVAVRPPKTKASESFKDSIAWLKHGADEVVVVPPSEAMDAALEAEFAKLSGQHRANPRRAI
jgi:hypothetical protein